MPARGRHPASRPTRTRTSCPCPGPASRPTSRRPVPPERRNGRAG
ncbi:hypothetical protein F750_0893 [Streptomyces sp. PAMC 26508]|nr:hypothetical protein F750_0893 [Streptomyces sp. PAMC 26508]